MLTCIECEDTEATIRCDDCEDMYCVLCFDAQHHAGSRRQHRRTTLVPVEYLPSEIPPPAPVSVDNAFVDVDMQSPLVTKKVTMVVASSNADDARERPSESDSDDDMTDASVFIRDAAYIPLRLSEEERAVFNLLDASLNVSEYTDKVDVLSYRAPIKRIIHELGEVFSTLSGMVVATDFRKGKRLIANTSFAQNAAFFGQVFEIGRRYKIMNPGMCN